MKGMHKSAKPVYNCTCVLSRIYHCTGFQRSFCNLSKAFLADFTQSDTFHTANHTLLFVWIESHDHSFHMSSFLQVQQLYTAGTPLLEAYLQTINNRTCKERLSRYPRGPDSYGVTKFTQLHVVTS